MVITGLGQILSIELPEGWTEHTQQSHTRTFNGARSVREFYAPDPSKAKLVFFYRGMAIDPDSAAAFSQIIKSPAHKISAQEFASLEEVLGNMAYAKDYRPSKVETVDLNGRRVLQVEGEYINARNTTIELLIDCDGTGSYVQQLYFLAPKDEFAQEASLAKQIINSIEWLQTA